ncbi:7285_t:CDS:2, partial [Acaulospora morrowiae]
DNFPNSSSPISGIVRLDAKAARYSDGLDIWHMEVAGLSDNAFDEHIINDAKKTLRTDLLNLIAILRNHLDCDVNIATKIKVFCTQVIKTRLTLYALNMLPDGRFLATELASVIIPFSFDGRIRYKSILRMMAIFHEEIEKQQTLMREIDRCVPPSKEKTVRQTADDVGGMKDRLSRLSSDGNLQHNYLGGYLLLSTVIVLGESVANGRGSTSQFFLSALLGPIRSWWVELRYMLQVVPSVSIWSV